MDDMLRNGKDAAIDERRPRAIDCQLSIHETNLFPHVWLEPALAKENDSTAPFWRILQGPPADEVAEDRSMLVFALRDASLESLGQTRGVQVSVPHLMAGSLGLTRNAAARILPASEDSVTASHVEVSFRDQYLTRGDIWRLVQDELSGQCLYRGQIVDFLGTIKVRIKALYRVGRKVDSAFFGPSTKPIFRSEAARYVLYIQMSKEMGDFDVQGSGELMYDKVVNGFLPDLFRKWHDLQVHHLVSIVLFSRMLYPNRHHEEEAIPSQPDLDTPQDFYRVVVSDMPSLDVAAILERLKRELLNFFRDVSIIPPRVNDLKDHLFASTGMPAWERPSQILAGTVASARAGNILEAINLASSQFANDCVDRDLVRTGVSVVIVTPGVGLFDVSYDLLKATTENLSEHGVSIDLVCLAPMPLHSVPLFRYEEFRTPAFARQSSTTPSESSSFQSTLSKPPSREHLSYASSSFHDSAVPKTLTRRYGVPHWLNISFWKRTARTSPLPVGSTPVHLSTQFKPCVKMHEIQMMGITGNLCKPFALPLMLFKGRTEAPREIPAPSWSKGSEISVSCSPEQYLLDDRRVSRSSRFRQKRTLMNTERSTAVVTEQSWMDAYDSKIFATPAPSRSQKSRLPSRQNRRTPFGGASLPAAKSIVPPPTKLSSGNIKLDLGQTVSRGVKTPSKVESSLTSGLRKAQTAPTDTSLGTTTPSKLILGPKGVAVTASTAAAIANTMPARALISESRQFHTASGGDRPSNFGRFERSSDGAGSPLKIQEEQDAVIGVTRPIMIKQDAMMRIQNGRSYHGRDILAERVDTLKELCDPEPESNDISQASPAGPTLSAKAVMAPWLTLLNPCNPGKTMMTAPSRLGRWQHVFPRPLRTAQMKWNSLCSPAVVPLTTEEFPSIEQWVDEYSEIRYQVNLSDDAGLDSQGVISEMVYLRLSKGFQFVVGERVAATLDLPQLRNFDCFNLKILNEEDGVICLMRGGTIHVLRRSGPRLRVIERSRHINVQYATREEWFSKTPMIKSMLGSEFKAQSVTLIPPAHSYDWESIDARLTRDTRNDMLKGNKGFGTWTARFVLIPTVTSGRDNKPGDDTEEETHLEGLQKLTCIWQKHVSTLTQPEIPSISVHFYTKDPSAVVQDEIDHAARSEDLSREETALKNASTTLLRREMLNLPHLAERIQSAEGVSIADRRWHWRLHQFCFVGSDLVNWILLNFSDIETRQEAAELGNSLMEQGLFCHVNSRHGFRDGNYFYQIADQYRMASSRTQGRSLFAWASGTPLPQSPATDLRRPDIPTPTAEPQQPDLPDKARSNDKPAVVMLSKAVVYRLDERHKRSWRQERIILHHDTVHNPSSCFHIQLEWLNTTAKLVQDSVVSWARTLEPYGLRLVEIPIGEASSITHTHPFRAPYLIKLALQPPDWAAEPNGKRDQTLQRALLRSFGYVLDFEAASAFPSQVRATYSWGRPDYRHAQFIHRSGLLLAQITGDGNILLLANRLYNSRSSSARVLMTEATRTSDRRLQPPASPFPSGQLAMQQSRHPSISRRESQQDERSEEMQEESQDQDVAVNPEQLARTLETFCQSASALSDFFTTELQRQTAGPPPSPNSGARNISRKTPLSTPGQHALIVSSTDSPAVDQNIPILALPSSLQG